MLADFKAFLLRGNLLELAVALVLGAAFGTVVTALVDNLVMPIIAAVGGKPDFNKLNFTINNAVFGYGKFITAVIAFLITAAAIYFLVVKPVTKLLSRVSKEEEAAADPHGALLTDIKALLEKQNELLSNR